MQELYLCYSIDQPLLPSAPRLAPPAFGDQQKHLGSFCSDQHRYSCTYNGHRDRKTLFTV